MHNNNDVMPNKQYFYANNRLGTKIGWKNGAEPPRQKWWRIHYHIPVPKQCRVYLTVQHCNGVAQYLYIKGYTIDWSYTSLDVQHILALVL